MHIITPMIMVLGLLSPSALWALHGNNSRTSPVPTKRNEKPATIRDCADFKVHSQWPRDEKAGPLPPAVVGTIETKGPPEHVQLSGPANLVRVRSMDVTSHHGGALGRTLVDTVSLSRGDRPVDLPKHLQDKEAWFSADGKTLATWEVKYGGQGTKTNFIRRDALTGKELARSPTMVEQFPMVFHSAPSAGKMVASIRDNAVLFWDAESPADLLRFDLATGKASADFRATEGVQTLAVLESRFSEDEKTLVLCVRSTEGGTLSTKEIQIYDLAQRRMIDTIRFPKGDCDTVAVSPDGKQVIFAEGTDLVSYKLHSGKPTDLTKLGEMPISVTFMPQGGYVLVGLLDDRAKVVSSISGNMVGEVQLGTSFLGPGLIGFGQSPHLFVSSSQERANIVDLNRMASPPSEMPAALEMLAMNHMGNFQAMRWLRCNREALGDFLLQNARGGVISDQARKQVQKSVAAWSSGEYSVRQSATVELLKAMQSMTWGQKLALADAIEAEVASSIKNIAQPAEVISRGRAFSASKEMHLIRKFKESESFRAEIEHALGAPLLGKDSVLGSLPY